MPGYDATRVDVKVIGLTRPGFEPTRSESPNLLRQEVDTWLIRPTHLVQNGWKKMNELHVLNLYNAICVIQYNLYLTTSTYRPLSYVVHFILVPNDCPCNTIVLIFLLPKPTSSLNGPFKVGPMVCRFIEVLLHLSYWVCFFFLFDFHVSCWIVAVFGSPKDIPRQQDIDFIVASFGIWQSQTKVINKLLAWNLHCIGMLQGGLWIQHYYYHTVKPLTDHLHRPTTCLYRSLYLGTKRSPITIF